MYTELIEKPVSTLDSTDGEFHPKHAVHEEHDPGIEVKSDRNDGEVPKFFVPLFSRMVKRLDWENCGSRKKEMFGGMSERLDMLRRFNHQMSMLVWQPILVTNLSAQKEDVPRAQEKVRKCIGLKQGRRYEPNVRMDWETAALPVETLREHLGSILEKECKVLVRKLARTLAEMVDRNVFGLLEYHQDAADVCKYYYFRSLYKHDVTALKEQMTKRVEDREQRSWGEFLVEKTINEHRVTLIHERHEHHLYESERLTYPWKDLKCPPYIRSMLDHIPDLFRDDLFVVEGEMVHEEVKSSVVVDETFKTEGETFATLIRQGQLWSPAVVIGDTVLSGWSDRDL